MSTALCRRNASQLVLIDVQEKLCGVMKPAMLEVVVANCSILLQAANLLQVSTQYTEQAPAKLGATLPELAQHLDKQLLVEKTSFSCCNVEKFCTQLAPQHSQLILAGMESHICVLQTALDLQAMGKQVFVVEDAIISRNAANKHNALERMRQAGVIVTNAESVVFEWLQGADHPAFREISRLIR